MQSTYNLKKEQIIPARGLLFCEPILGQYETESGILVVKDLKRNPKIYSMKVISIGGPFTIHGRKDCKICGGFCKKKERQGKYWAKPGDTIWMKRGYKKIDIEGKTHCFLHNSDIVAVKRGDILAAPADMVLIDPVYDGMAEGSKIIFLADRDKEYVGNYWGIIVSVGPEYPWILKTGDKIRFRRHEGVKVEVDGKKLLSLKSKWVDGLEK